MKSSQADDIRREALRRYFVHQDRLEKLQGLVVINDKDAWQHTEYADKLFRIINLLKNSGRFRLLEIKLGEKL